MEELLATVPSELKVNAMGPILVHLLMAVSLGAVIAYRPWRFVLGIPLQSKEMIHAQILIALAGAIVVTVVGDSLARAFGLVGLGGFIRFRTGIRDPRDAAVFFLLIGLGMACGLGALGIALVCAAFVGGVVFLFDLGQRPRAHPFLRITATSADPLLVSGQLQKAIESFHVIVRNSSIKLDSKEVRFDVETPKTVDLNELKQTIFEETKGQVVSLQCEALETIKKPKV